MEQDGKMPGLVRGSQMTPQDLKEFLLKKAQQKNDVDSTYQGLNQKEAARFQDAMGRIQSAPVQQRSPEEQYVDQMPGSEVDDAFKSALSPEDLIKLKALHKMRMGR